jgi:hypothetical protein
MFQTTKQPKYVFIQYFNFRVLKSSEIPIDARVVIYLSIGAYHIKSTTNNAALLRYD